MNSVGVAVILALTSPLLPARIACQESADSVVGFLTVGELSQFVTLSKGSVLPEVAMPSVARVVLATARSHAIGWGFIPACSRYFANSEVVVAVLSGDCHEGSIPRDDVGEGIIVMDRNGELVGSPLRSRHLPPNSYLLVPAFRVLKACPPTDG